MTNLIRKKKKGSICTIIKKPIDGVLNKKLVKILKNDGDNIEVIFLKDTYVLGSKSKKGAFYNIAHVIEAIEGKKPSSSVTPWSRLAKKLEEKNHQKIKMISNSAPLHYKDELCIPCNTNKQNGEFYIIKKDEVKRLIDLTKKDISTELMRDEKIYFKKYFKESNLINYLDPIKVSIDIGNFINDTVSLNDDIDVLFVNIQSSDGIGKSIEFEIQNKLIDVYRFLTIFDSNEYENVISKHDIVNSHKIIISSYKNCNLVDKVELLTKDLLKPA